MIFRASRQAAGSFLSDFLTVLLLAAVSSCAAKAEGRLEQKDLVIISSGVQVSLKAEIARTGSQRAMGLMYRKELKDSNGMLFVFETDEALSFWMKNTYIPLSIAFIGSDGFIHEIRDMQPQILEPVQSLAPARYALEVPQGWFSRAGIAPGSRLVVGGLQEDP